MFSGPDAIFQVDRSTELCAPSLPTKATGPRSFVLDLDVLTVRPRSSGRWFESKLRAVLTRMHIRARYSRNAEIQRNK